MKLLVNIAKYSEDFYVECQYILSLGKVESNFHIKNHWQGKDLEEMCV